MCVWSSLSEEEDEGYVMSCGQESDIIHHPRPDV
jgi:hypothetical protein